MKALARRVAAFLVCTSIVWVSPGLEAYAAESRIVPLTITTPVNGGAATTLKPLQVPAGSLNAGFTGQSLEIPGANVPGIEVGPQAQLNGPAAGIVNAQSPEALTHPVAQAAAPVAPGLSASAPARTAVAAVTPEIEAAVAAGPVDANGQVKIESGAKAERVANTGLIGRGLRAIKDAFSSKTGQTLTDPASTTSTPVVEGAASKSPEARLNAASSQAPPSGTVPPAPPAKPGDDGSGGGKKSKGSFLGLGIAGFSIIGYMLAMQVGLEAQGVAMPQLTENAFKDFTLLPLVTVFASIGSMIGQPMSKFFTEKFGLAKTFYAAHALRAISLGAMVLLFGTGMMSMPLMMGFYLINGIVTGVASTAEGTLRKLILAEKGVSQQNYRTWWQLLAESLAVPAPIFFGGLVATLGAIGAPLVTAIYPVSILLGLILAYILKVYPLKDVKKASDAAQAQSAQTAQAAQAAARPSTPAPKKGVWKGIKEAAAKIFANMEEGKNYVLSIPYLKYSLIAATVFDLLNVVIYRLIAPGYGKMTGGAAGLSAVQGNIVGMFSLGGLLLSVVFILLENAAKRRAKAASPTADQAAAAERKSMLRWAMAGIPALALLGTMAVNVALPLAPLIFMGTNWMPASLLAAALVPFGFFQVAASIKLNSYFQEKLPHDAAKVQKALAFAGSVMTALSIVTMLIMRPLFSAVTVFNPFPWVAGALIPVAVGLFFLHRKLAHSTTPEAVAAADAEHKQLEAGPEQAPAKAGGYVGMVLGIVAAAVIITALPMLPGIGGFMAGLGVLAKFGINLGLTLGVPAAGWFIGRARQKKAK